MVVFGIHFFRSFENLFIHAVLSLGCQEYEDLKVLRERKKENRKRMVWLIKLNILCRLSYKFFKLLIKVFVWTTYNEYYLWETGS